MRQRVPALLILAFGILMGRPVPVYPEEPAAPLSDESSLYSLPAPERLLPTPTRQSPSPPSPWPLSGRAGLVLMEAEPLLRTPGFLPEAWAWDLSLRRTTRLDGELAELLREKDEISRIPYRREETYLAGEVHLHLRDWEEAARSFSRFVAEYPSDSLLVSALLGWGEASYRAGRSDEALHVFLDAKGRATEPDEIWMAGRSASWIQRELGDTSGARLVLESLLAGELDRQRESLVRLDLAELELACGRTARAIGLLDPWAEALGSAEGLHMDPRGYLLLAWSHFREHEWPAAEAAFGGLLRTTEAPPPMWIARAHAALGWIRLQQGDMEGAETHYERSVNVEGGADAMSVYGLALARQRQGDLGEALSLLDRWDQAIPQELAWRWSFARGFILFQMERYDEVSGALADALTSGHPDSLRFHAMLLLGDAKRRSERPRDALDAYQRAVTLTDDPPEDLLWRWAVVSLGLERWGEASRVLRDLLTRFPGSTRRDEQAFWRGEALYRLGRYREADESYRVALRAGHPPGPVRYGLGWCAYVRGQFDDAARHFGAALDQGIPEAQAADAALRLGHALSNLRDWDGARRAYEQAQRFGRGTLLEDQARFRQAWLLLRGGRADDAGQAWEKLSRETSDRSLASHSVYWAGQARFASSSYEEAVHLFREAEANVVLSDSMRAVATLGAADALYNLEQWDGAMEAYRSLISRAGATRTIRVAAADGVYNTLAVLEDWEEASRFLDEVTQAFPEISRQGERHLRIADGLMEGGELEKAARAYESFTSRNDLSGSLLERGHVGHARALEALGQWKEAAEQWEEAGRNADTGRQGSFWLDAARLYLRAESWRDAVRLLEELKGRRVRVLEEWRVPLYLAQAYERLERIGPAAESWRETAVLAPSDTLKAKAWANAGRLYIKMESWDEAVNAYGRVDSLGSFAALYRSSYWIGEALHKLEEWERAESAFASFLRDVPEEPLWEAMARMRRAECLEQLERWEDALGEYDRVLDLEGEGLAESLLEEARIRQRQVTAWSSDTTRTRRPKVEDDEIQ